MLPKRRTSGSTVGAGIGRQRGPRTRKTCNKKAPGRSNEHRAHWAHWNLFGTSPFLPPKNVRFGEHKVTASVRVARSGFIGGSAEERWGVPFSFSFSSTQEGGTSRHPV